jgi:hypothetical protein
VFAKQTARKEETENAWTATEEEQKIDTTALVNKRLT